jgi:hypothetical protein
MKMPKTPENKPRYSTADTAPEPVNLMAAGRQCAAKNVNLPILF